MTCIPKGMSPWNMENPLCDNYMLKIVVIGGCNTSFPPIISIHQLGLLGVPSPAYCLFALRMQYMGDALKTKS